MNIFRYRLLLPALVFLAGCQEKLLDTIPRDRVSAAIYWKTEQDAELAANAIYTFHGSTENYFSWDGMSDLGHIGQIGNRNLFILRGDADALNSRFLEEWSLAYYGIRGANSFLEHVDQVETANTVLIDRLKMEVRALRAYYYIRLASLYGDVPLVTQELSLDESKQLTRTPVAEIWDFISEELEEAGAGLPVAQAQKGRMTRGAAWALKARAMLYAGRYAEAAASAAKVMALNQYSLYPSYKNLFSYEAENNPEVIFDIQYVKDVYRNNVFGLMAPYSQRNSGNRFVPTKNLVDAYQMTNGLPITDPASGFDPRDPYKDRDPRLSYTVFVLGDPLPDGQTYDPRPGSGTADEVHSSFVTTQTGFNLKKYIHASDLAQPANCGINLVLVRYAEVLLTYAEAKIEMNELDQSVLDAINAIRTRPDVNMPPIPALGTQEEMREIVRHERKVELAFEGLRYVDIRRWKIAEHVMPGKIYGMTYVNDNDELETIEVLTWTTRFDKNKDYLWPIPQKEIELNPNLTQNPNW